MKKKLSLILLLGLTTILSIDAGIPAACAKQLEALSQLKWLEKLKKSFGFAGNGIWVFVAISSDIDYSREAFHRVIDKPFSTHSVKMFYATAGILFLIAAFMRVTVSAYEAYRPEQVRALEAVPIPVIAGLPTRKLLASIMSSLEKSPPDEMYMYAE